jgi:hypothetical protein
MTGHDLLHRTATLVAAFSQEALRVGADPDFVRRAAETFFEAPFADPDLRGRICITCARPLSPSRLCVQCTRCFVGTRDREGR